MSTITGFLLYYISTNIVYISIIYINLRTNVYTYYASVKGKSKFSIFF